MRLGSLLSLFVLVWLRRVSLDANLLLAAMSLSMASGVKSFFDMCMEVFSGFIYSYYV